MAENSNRVAIVGGGIAGLYAAWKLAARGYEVTLYECLDRLGGRIETLDWGVFQAECGPMRFELATQPLLDQLGKDLKIHFEEFAAPEGESSRFPRYDLDEDEKTEEQLAAEAELADRLSPPAEDSDIIQLSHKTSSLDLLKLAVYRILNPAERSVSLRELTKKTASGLSRIEAYANQWHDNAASDSDRHYDRIRVAYRLDGNDGPYLQAIGFWNALARVLSAGALAKLRDTGTFYHLMPENPSASEWSIFWLRLFRSDSKLWTIPAGVGALTQALTKVLEGMPGVTIRTSARVTGIRPASQGVSLVWEEARDRKRHRSGVFAHVVLALPQMPLKQLAAEFPDAIRKDVDGVNAFPLTKVFVKVRKRWWAQQPKPQTGAHVLPTREVHYFTPKNPADPSGMVMFYTDRPATAYWHPFVAQDHQRAQLNTPPALRDELVHEVLKELLTYAYQRAVEGWEHSASAVRETVDILAADRGGQHTRLRMHRARLSFSQDAPAALRELRQILGFFGESPFRQELDTLADGHHITRAVDDNIEAFAIRDWSRPPFGAAAHAWEPGVNVPAARARLCAFGLKSHEHAGNLHICGEAYSDYQGFIEGALRTVEAVIAAIGTATPAKAPSANSRAPKLRAGGARHRASAGARAAVQKRRPTT